jgi:hypothetical protein
MTDDKPKPKSKYRFRSPASRRAGKGKPAGKLKFIPTDEQRFAVAACAALGMNLDEIALTVRNPQTGKPVAAHRLHTWFKNELTGGRADLKASAAAGLVEGVKARKEWALRATLRNAHNWIFEGQQVPPAFQLGNNNNVDEIQITFHPGPGNRKQEPVDITPDPYANQAPDLSRPALASPPPRTVTPTGAIYEHPDPYSHLPKMYPPDHVDNTKGGESLSRPRGPADWMK